MKISLLALLFLELMALPFVSTYLSAQQDSPLIGSPLPGITSRELELFRMGREDFLEVETAAEGLGPVFNGTSCAQCHNIPVIGGTGTMVEMRAGYKDENGKFSAPSTGTLMHLFSIPPHTCQVSISAVYDEANVIAHRISMPLLGVGLVEAIPDETLIALSDPDDRDGDAISGRAAMVKDLATGRERVGRFGWKAQHATILAFAADAYFNEMGITNDLFRHEVTIHADSKRLIPCDTKPDPEDIRDPRTGLRGIDRFENFLRLLAPPPRLPMNQEATRGEALFGAIGCSACHVAVLQTGMNPNPVFNRKPVHLFSDLLVHDIGTGDGIEQESVTGEEIRTPSLWGLRFRRPLLHDGSASTIEKAIERHRGEATAVQERFAKLPQEQKAEVLAFLKTI